jgi:nitrogen regulatory protein P-II 1
MEYRKVTAIIGNQRLEAVERRLEELGVGGISVSRVKGYGDYRNFYTRDWMTSHARVEIFTDAARADGIAEAILDAAHTGQPGDGIVAVLPVERIYRIRTRAEATPDDF